MSIVIKSEEGVTLECLHNVNQKLAVCIEEEGTYPLVFEFDNEKDVDFFIDELRKAKKSVFNQEQTENVTYTFKMIINGELNPILKSELSGRVYHRICCLYIMYDIPKQLDSTEDVYNFIGFLTTIRGISKKSVHELNYFFEQYGLFPDYPTTSYYIRNNKDMFLLELKKLFK